MPHASEIHGKYHPHNTNRIPDQEPAYEPSNDAWTSNDGVTSRSSAPPRQAQISASQPRLLFEKKAAGVTSAGTFWTTQKIVLLFGLIIVVLVAVGVTVAVVLATRTNNTTVNSTVSASVTGSVTSTTNNSSSSNTTFINPCSSSGTLWNTVGVPLLNNTQLSTPNGLYVDSNNTVYVTDESYACVWRLYSNAVNATVVAGTYQSGGSSSSQLNAPQDVYVDANKNIYVSDYNNYRIQKYANGYTNGSTIAGVTGSGGGALTQFNPPRFFSFDPTETYMYVADFYNQRILRFLTNSTTGTSGTVVAGGSGGYANTTLYYPLGVSYSAVNGDLYITNVYGHNAMRWTPGASSGYVIAGVIPTYAETPILMNQPFGIKTDIYQNVYIVDNQNHRVQMFCANSQVGITVAGNGIAGSTTSQLYYPRYITFDSAMNMYVSDTSNSRVIKFTKL